MENKEHSLPIASEVPEKGYDTSKTVKFMDSKKPLFQVRTKLVSSVYPEEEKLQAFFGAIQESQKPGNDDALLHGIEALREVNQAEILKFAPILLDELFRILGLSFPSDDIPRKAFLAIVHVLQLVNNQTAKASRRDPTLVAYVHYRFSNHSNSKKLVFEEITRFWLALHQESDSSIKTLEKFPWFFFELIVKSIIQHLKDSMQWKTSMVPDSKWFKPAFLKNLETLVITLIRDVVLNFVETHNHSSAKLMNDSIAYFLADCFPFLNRQLIFTLVRLFFFSPLSNFSLHRTKTPLPNTDPEVLGRDCVHRPGAPDLPEI